MLSRLLVAMLACLLPGLSFAVACTDIFSNAVGTTGGELKLDGQPRLVNTGGGVLATDDLSASGKNANKICDNSPCSASGTPAPTAPLPANSSNTDYDNSVLSFAAGDYYYQDFTLSGGQSVELVVTSGTVRIHVAGKLMIDDAKANFGGVAEDLVFLVAGDVDIKDKAKVKALIYSEGEVAISGNATQVIGAVTGQSVEVTDKARVTFDDGAVAAADFNGFCDGATGGTVDAAAFNCVVSGADPLSGHLYLQKVATPFSFDVVALADTDGDGAMDAVETGFAASADRPVTVELVDASAGGACAVRPALAPAVSQTLTFTAANAGRRTSAAMSSDRAYRTVGCRVTDNTPSPNVVACSTDTFTIRPESLVLATPILNNTDHLGSPAAVAGSSFSLMAVGGTGYTGTPQFDNARLLAHAAAIRTGSLSGAFGAASAATGAAVGSSFAYSEVGNFRFAVQGLFDDSFAAGDAANGDCTSDFSNVRVGGRFGCNFGNLVASDWIGRFQPARFTLATQAQGALSATCAGFSYQEEEIGFATSPVFRVTAQNLAGDVTENYSGDYAKLAGSSFTLATIDSDGTQLGADGINKVTAAWSTLGNRVVTDNLNGTLDLSFAGAGFTWGRGSNDLVAPFTTDLDIGVTGVMDSDGVVAIGLPETADPIGLVMHYGRVALSNAYGSELQHLPVPMQVQHYTGSASGFVNHAADNCSTISAIAFTDPDTTDGLATSETCVWDDDNDSGSGCAGAAPAGLEYELPSVGGLYNLNLKAPGAGNSGVLRVDASVPDHLKFGWLGAAKTDPRALATFGIFNRPTAIIYRREVR